MLLCYTLSMEKGEKLTVEIVDMTEDGTGIGRTDGMAIFVTGGAVYGDIVSCTITKTKKNYAFAALGGIITPSEFRRKEACPHLSECGGCAFGALEYDVQIELKMRQLRNKLVRIAGIDDPHINPMIAAYSTESDVSSGDDKEDGCVADSVEGNSLSYRNKAVMAVGQDEQGKPLIGFRSAKSHRVIDCDECRIQMPTAMAAAKALREFMQEYNISAFNQITGKGLIRHLLVRVAASTKKVMVVLVINGQYIPYAEELAYMLDESIADLQGEYILDSIVISQKNENVNKRSRDGVARAGMVLGDKSYILAGKRTIRDKLMGLEFDISAESFYQVNSSQTVRLYEEVLRMIDAKAGEKIVDVYCGIGTIGLIAASQSNARFLGIESVAQAIRDSNKNAIRNRIVNAAFIEGKAEEVFPEMLAHKNDSRAGDSINDEEEYMSRLLREFASPDAVILDPPRAGCEHALVEAVIKAKPNRIVYVSCDQGTMARDVKAFIEAGYTLKETTPCDMFPETGALESVSLLVK